MKWVKFLAKLAVAAAILAVLFAKAGSKDIWQNFSRVPWHVFVTAVLAYCFMESVKTYRLQILLRALGVGISYTRLLRIYFIGMFFNTVLPTIVGGDAVRVTYLYRETGKLDRAVAASLMERALGVGALILIAVAALVFTPAAEVVTGVAESVIVVTACFLAGILLLFSPWVYRIGTKCMRAIGLRKVEELIGKMQRAIAVYRRRHAVLGVAMLLSCGMQFGMIAIYALLAYSMGLRLPLHFFLMAVPVTVLLSMAPVTVSGLGVRELTWVFLLAGRDVPQADAIALSLMWFAVVTVSSVFGAPAFLLWRKPHRVDDRAKVAAEPSGRRD